MAKVEGDYMIYKHYSRPARGAFANRKARVEDVYFEVRTPCFRCNGIIYREKAFRVTRWDSAMHKRQYIYCKKCTKSAAAVINLIDKDEVNYGVAWVDSFLDFKKIDDSESEHFKYELLKPLIKSDTNEGPK